MRIDSFSFHTTEGNKRYVIFTSGLTIVSQTKSHFTCLYRYAHFPSLLAPLSELKVSNNIIMSLSYFLKLTLFCQPSLNTDVVLQEINEKKNWMLCRSNFNYNVLYLSDHNGKKLSFSQWPYALQLGRVSNRLNAWQSEISVESVRDVSFLS